MDYISYFDFLGTMKKWIHDAEIDFTFENLSGEEFDTRFKALLNKLEGRCVSYCETCSLTKQRTKFMNAYLKDIREASSFPQEDRFKKLLSVTDDYIRLAV